jgi:class 3 adenylate cyclase
MPGPGAAVLSTGSSFACKIDRKDAGIIAQSRLIRQAGPYRSPGRSYAARAVVVSMPLGQELRLPARGSIHRGGGPRQRVVLQNGLALVAAGAFGDLVGSFLRGPRWAAGLDATNAAVLGLVLAGLGRTFRHVRAYRERTARAQALVRSYVPGPVAEGILDADQAADIALHRRSLSVLFADLQSFAELTESLDPGILTHILEGYFAAVAGAVELHGGSIHKYLGDGVMVLFGLERRTTVADHGLRAVRAALAIQEAIAARAARGTIPVPLAVRIGISSGVVSVGSFGPPLRRDFTAIGPAVNRAARLQAHCRPGGILLDHGTWRLVRDRLRCTPRGEIRLKGLRGQLRVYEAGGSDSPTLTS